MGPNVAEISRAALLEISRYITRVIMAIRTLEGEAEKREGHLFPGILRFDGASRLFKS